MCCDMEVREDLSVPDLDLGRNRSKRGCRGT